MDAIPPHLLAAAHTLIARNETGNSTSSGHSLSSAARPPVYKVVGIILAVASGLFIGTSFVLKKVGLLKANAKYNEEAGEGYGYLKNGYWWGGMSLMILGEVCNFVAYAFTDAILVTPLGALSVVITTVLSAIFLKERLSFVGKVGCFNCIVGSVIIPLNAPEQSAVADIQEMKKFVIAPGFLTYAAVVIVACLVIIWFVAPKYGKKSVFVYLSVCSLIGGLSVVATQGLGAAVVAQAQKGHQFNQWFLYLLLVFVVGTLLTEIVYLNKALNLFNAALVTPTYYVYFTSTTIITSAVLFQGFRGTVVTIVTVILGFLQICSGVVLLQLSKSAKDVPDAAIFKGDLDQIREVGEQEQSEHEPKADAIRGTAAIIRRLSTPRRNMEQAEARRLREEKLADLEPVQENEVVEWDGIRRRKTVIGVGPTTARSPVFSRPSHPPIGMSRFPDFDEHHDDIQNQHDFFGDLRRRASSVLTGRPYRHTEGDITNLQSPAHPVALTDIKVHPTHTESPVLPYGPGSLEEAHARIHGEPTSRRVSPHSKPLPAEPAASPSPGLPVPTGARRQFSFTNFLHRNSKPPTAVKDVPGPSRPTTSVGQKKAMKDATEEERLGLVKGDSNRAGRGSEDDPRGRDSNPSSPVYPLSKQPSHSEPSFSNPKSHPQYTYTRGRSYHRTDSPDAMSDSDREEPRPGHGPPRLRPLDLPSMSLSTNDVTAPSQPRPSSRKRPTPPAVYTPPVPPPGSQSHRPPPADGSSATGQSQHPTLRKITTPLHPAGTPSDPASAGPQSFYQQITQDRQASAAASSQHTPAGSRRPSTTRRPSQTQITISHPHSRHPSRDTRTEHGGGAAQPPPVGTVNLDRDRDDGTEDDDNPSPSKERFAQQSAREREERRQRAEKRQSQGGGRK